MDAIRLRRWIGRGNVLLAGAVVVTGGLIVRRGSQATDTPACACPTRAEPAEAAQAARASSAASEFATLVRAIGRFGGGRAGEASSGPRVAIEPPSVAPLPLAAYKIALVVPDPGNETVVIASKDPGRPERHHLVRGTVVDGILLEAVIDRGDEIVARLSRDAERHDLVWRTEVCGIARIVAARVRDAPDVDAPARRGGGSASDAGLRCVPFYGSDGAAIGLRVTGIATESVFATMGLHPGDAIVELDGDRLTDPGALERRWRTGWRPAEVAVVPADRPLALPDRRRLR